MSEETERGPGLNTVASNPNSVPMKTSEPPLVVNPSSVTLKTSEPPFVLNPSFVTVKTSEPPFVLNPSSVTVKTSEPPFAVNLSSVTLKTSEPPFVLNPSSVMVKTSEPPFAVNLSSVTVKTSEPPFTANPFSDLVRNPSYGGAAIEGRMADITSALAHSANKAYRIAPSLLPSNAQPSPDLVAPQRDVFISHASEDKHSVARPLAKALRRAGLTVWFDEEELTLGDSLRRKIDEALKNSRFGVVILSPRFFSKEWPQRELDGLLALEGGEKRILPIWHEVTAIQVRDYSPMLADRLAVRTTEGVRAVAKAIIRVVKR